MNELTSEEIILSGLSGSIEGGLEGRRKRANVSKLGATLFRKQMIERIPRLPSQMQKHLKEDRAQISDKEYFVIRQLEGTSTDIIKKNEKSEAGLRNIDDAELGENQFFLLSALSLQYRSEDSGRFDELFPDFLANAVFTSTKDEELFDVPYMIKYQLTDEISSTYDIHEDNVLEGISN
jgi:hypothetical protein